MNFLERAMPYAQMGIPVFPLRPGTKEPPSFMGQWQEHATTDPSQIAAWNAEDPNYNCALVARPEGAVFLEFDVGEGMKAAAKETGQSMPITRVHVSGKGFAHWVFLQTDRSRALGNRQARKKEGGEWFSFRQNNRYLVGPGSVHPNGNEYFVNPKRVIPPEPIPDWVCDWVERYTLSEKSDSDYPDVVDEFDFDDWLEHYDISIKTTVGYWHIADEGCVVAGYFHEHSTLTGIFFDGAKLGWHCFAGGCEGSSMSIGGFIKWLNQRKGQEPYDKPIWPEREETGADEELDMAHFENTDLEPKNAFVSAFTRIFPNAVTKATGVAPAKELCQAREGSRCQCGLEHRYLQSTLRPEIQVAVAECMSPETSEPEEIPVASQTTQDEDQEATKLRMPEEAMYGRLGELARLTELPLGLAYPALLGEFSIYQT